MTQIKSLAFALVFSIIASLNFSVAWEFEVTEKFDSLGNLTPTYVVSCAQPSDEQFCSTLCHAPEHCENPIPFCKNCLGTASETLRNIFSGLSEFFDSASTPLPAESVTGLLQSERFTVLFASSLENYYSTFDMEKTRENLLQLCHGPDLDRNQSPYLFVQLDEEHLPREPKLVLCKDKRGQESAFKIITRE